MATDETTLRAVKRRIVSDKKRIEELKEHVRMDQQWLRKLLEDHEHFPVDKICEFCDERVVCVKCDNLYDEDRDFAGLCVACLDKEDF